MKITEKTLAEFRAWLADLGLAEGTLDDYERTMERVDEEPGGYLARLRDTTLSPKTRRKELAAIRQWGEFVGDPTIREKCKKLRLPPPRRMKAKIPLERAQLFALIDEIGRSKDISEPTRAVLGIMACRGLRCGDALRLRRSEILDAQEKGILSFLAKGERRLEFRVLKTWKRYLDLLARQGGDWTHVRDLVSPGADPKKAQRSAARAIERALEGLALSIQIRGVYPHQLRRTYAVQYLQAMRGDPEALVKLTQHMQWAQMTTAMEYVDHARGDELDTVAERIFER